MMWWARCRCRAMSRWVGVPPPPPPPRAPSHTHWLGWPGCMQEAVWASFIGRVRDNLHIVLTMSPVGDSFRTRWVGQGLIRVLAWVPAGV